MARLLARGSEVLHHVSLFIGCYPRCMGPNFIVDRIPNKLISVHREAARAVVPQLCAIKRLVLRSFKSYKCMVHWEEVLKALS